MKSRLIIASFLLASCATPYDFKSPVVAPNVKDEVELAQLETRAKEEPNNLVLRTHIARQKEYLVRQFITDAETAIKRGDLDATDSLLDRALKINPAAPVALAGKKEVEDERRHRTWIKEAEESLRKDDTESAQAKLRKVLIENPNQPQAKSLLKQIAQKRNAVDNIFPALRVSISKPITLEFRDTSIRTVFELISRNANINFIFDKEVRGDTKTTIFVRNTKIEDAIKLLLVTNQLEKKILSENTILIYPNTPQKLKEYQELVVRSFYLANADVKQTMNVLKTVIKTNDLVFDEKLNMLIMRDTPEAIRLAEKLIAAQDMAEPEVMLELEVMEVSRNRLQELGVRFPERLSLSAIGASTTPGSLTLDEWKGLNSGTTRLTVTDPTLILNLRRIDTDTNLLANPRIRVKNREKAKVHIGERVPVITTTSTANVGVSESVTYLDVGLKLDIEPNVFLDDDVSMRVGLEVSNILETITRTSGTQTYRLGTRNTSTTLRLKDGETQVLAGLIQDDERKAVNKLPGIGSLPLIGRLFSNSNSTKTKTEIVLLITPRIIRNLQQPEIDVAEFSSGTADSIGSAPLGVRAVEVKESAPVVAVPALIPVQPQTLVPVLPQPVPVPKVPQSSTPESSVPSPTVPAPVTVPSPDAI